MSAAAATFVTALLTVVAPPAAMPREPGWHVGAAHVTPPGCPRCVQTASWASTVRYRDAPNDLPHKTMATLGPSDLIVLVDRSWQPSPPAWMLQRHPLRIIRAQIHANFEGFTRPGRFSVWSAATWRNGSFVTVDVFFGSPTPTAAAIARAQRELELTRFALWSI